MEIRSRSLIVALFFGISMILFGFRIGQRDGSPIVLNLRMVPSVPVQATTRISEGDEGKYLHQTIELAWFAAEVEGSSLSLVRPVATFTPDGYVDTIRPEFAPMGRSTLDTIGVLAFGKDDRFMKACVPDRIAVCVRNVIGRENEVRQFFVLPEEPSKDGLMYRAIIVVYGTRRIAI